MPFWLSVPKQPPVNTVINPPLWPYLLALRPYQWTKNLIAFTPPVFAFNLTEQVLLGSLLAFVLFCCVSSGFYLLNDILDVKFDRQHPVKSMRPIAAGLVSIPAAIGMAVLLLGFALIGGWLQSSALGATLIAYAILQTAYNLQLKHIPVLDIVVLSIGFVLRAYAGFAATGVALSVWLLLCTAMLALFLAVEKRKAELRLLVARDGKTRAVLKHYSLALLTRMEGMAATGSVLSYAIWSSGPQVNGAPTPWMMLTLPFVVCGIFRYQLLSDAAEGAHENAADHKEGGRIERPEEILLTDLSILLTIGGWLLTAFVILWLKHQQIIH
jgi:decaprenyl-phosphate phosphoribosyltransferase